MRLNMMIVYGWKIQQNDDSEIWLVDVKMIMTDLFILTEVWILLAEIYKKVFLTILTLFSD